MNETRFIDALRKDWQKNNEFWFRQWLRERLDVLHRVVQPQRQEGDPGVWRYLYPWRGIEDEMEQIESYLAEAREGPTDGALFAQRILNGRPL